MCVLLAITKFVALLYDSFWWIWSISKQFSLILWILINFNQNVSKEFHRVVKSCEINQSGDKSHRVTSRTCETHLAVKKLIFHSQLAYYTIWQLSWTKRSYMVFFSKKKSYFNNNTDTSDAKSFWGVRRHADSNFRYNS